MKQIFSCCAILIFLFACNTKNNTIANNEKIITQYFEHFNQHDFKKMADLYAENASFKDPSLDSGIQIQTKQQIIAKYTQLASLFPDLTDQIIQLYPSGENHIIVEFISKGTGPDKIKFSLPICTIFTIENGLITKDFTYFDNFDESTSTK